MIALCYSGQIEVYLGDRYAACAPGPKLMVHYIMITFCYSGQIEVYLGDRYAACAPGPKLMVHYTGLVEPPSKVWCEHVTGHSAMIVWSKGK